MFLLQNKILLAIYIFYLIYCSLKIDPNSRRLLPREFDLKTKDFTIDELGLAWLCFACGKIYIPVQSVSLFTTFALALPHEVSVGKPVFF